MGRSVRTRLDWAALSDTPLSVLLQLCNDTDDEIARTAARNFQHTEQSLAQLVQHSSARVRIEVACHPNVTVDLLNFLLLDTDASVREEARRRLPHALLLSAPQDIEQRWDEGEGLELLLPSQQTEQHEPNQSASDADAISSEYLPHADNGVRGGSARPTAVALPPAPPTRIDHPAVVDTMAQSTTSTSWEASPSDNLTPNRPTRSMLVDTPTAELTPEGIAESLFELTDEDGRMDQATLFERFAHQRGLVLDAPLEMQLMRTLQHLSAARRISRIIAKPDPSIARMSGILIERRGGRPVPPLPTPPLKQTSADLPTLPVRNKPQKVHSTQLPFVLPMQPELRTVVSPQPVVEQTSGALFEQGTSFSFNIKERLPKLCFGSLQADAVDLSSDVVLPAVSTELNSSLSHITEELTPAPVVAGIYVVEQDVSEPLQPSEEVGADFFWLTPADTVVVEELPSKPLRQPHVPPTLLKPISTPDIEESPDSFGLYLPFIPAQQEFVDEGVNRKTLRQRAEQLAAGLVADYQLELDDVDPLADVFEVTSVGQVKQAVERLLQRGAGIDEITLCFQLKCLWLECPDYNTTWSYRRGMGWSTYQLYDNLSWPLALRFIRGFNGFPHIDEVHYALAFHFERWSRIREYGSHYSFVSYLMTLTDGFEHPFDWDYFGPSHESAAH